MSSLDQQHPSALSPKCRATTGDAFKGSTDRRLRPNAPCFNDGDRSNVFREAQFSPDGTTIITHNEDQCLRSYALPADLLDEKESPHELRAHSFFHSPNNIQSYAIYPRFDLQEYASTLLLCGGADVPITLRNAFDLESVGSSYPFINPITEEHRAPNSLAFAPDGRHFIAGSYNHLAVFDCHRAGEEPVVSRNLRPSRGHAQTDPWSFTRRAIVSTLSMSCEGLLAVGTLQREVGIYENEGMGRCSSTFPLQDGPGGGVTGLKWSPMGMYLLVAERQSDSVHVFDIRNTGQKISTLVGRQANTPQKLGIDVIPTKEGYEVWAGGTDGCVRMWNCPGNQEGLQAPDAVVQLHDGPVSSAMWHPSGAVLATCSGQIYPRNDHSDSEDDSEGDECSSDNDDHSAGSRDFFVPNNTLNVWTL